MQKNGERVLLYEMARAAQELAKKAMQTYKRNGFCEEGLRNVMSRMRSLQKQIASRILKV